MEEAGREELGKEGKRRKREERNSRIFLKCTHERGKEREWRREETGGKMEEARRTEELG